MTEETPDEWWLEKLIRKHGALTIGYGLLIVSCGVGCIIGACLGRL